MASHLAKFAILQEFKPLVLLTVETRQKAKIKQLTNVKELQKKEQDVGI